MNPAEFPWIVHSEQFLVEVESIKSMDSRLWLSPILPGKWSVGEIVSHLIAWDRYRLETRLPFMKSGAKLIGIERTAAEAKNEQAAHYAHSGISQGDLLNELIFVRRNMMDYLLQLSPEELNAKCSINNNELTPNTFMNGFIEHDLHHMNQIQTFRNHVK